MKKTFSAVIISLLIFSLSVSSAYAHGGSLDETGGHYDSSTGEYHYHHGYPAHQHENGQCPYDFDDQTNRDYTPSVQNTPSVQQKTEYSLWDHITNILTAVGTSLMMGLVNFLLFSKILNSKFGQHYSSDIYFYTVLIFSFLGVFLLALSSIYSIYAWEALIFFFLFYIFLYHKAKTIHNKRQR